MLGTFALLGQLQLLGKVGMLLFRSLGYGQIRGC